MAGRTDDVEDGEASGCKAMSYRLLIEDGICPQLRFFNRGSEPATRDWRWVGLAAVNDNDGPGNDQGDYDGNRSGQAGGKGGEPSALARRPE